MSGMRTASTISPGSSADFERAGHKIFNRKITSSRKAAKPDLRAQRRQGRNPVRRRIGVTERSADGAAVAHRAIGDGGGDPLHGAAGHVGYSSVLDIAMRDAGADHELVAAAFGPSRVRQARRYR